MALLGVAVNSFFSPFSPSESRGHSHENELFAQFAAFGRLVGIGTLSDSLRRDSLRSETGCNCCTCCCFAAKAAAMLLRRCFSR